MKFEVEEWTLEDLYQMRDRVNFPVYQRGEVWSEGQKQLLIDSIFRGIDIPKLYLQNMGDGQWDCIDGHQRILSVIGYFDGAFKYEGQTFQQLEKSKRQTFEKYRLTISAVSEINQEEVRTLFKRLQLGNSLNSGERLNAIISNLGEFVKRMRVHEFIQSIGVTERRYAREQVCAQICNNSRYINKAGSFRSSKYEDLENLYRVHKNFDLDSSEARQIMLVLDELHGIFGIKARDLTSRASVVSIYLFVEELYDNGLLPHCKQDVGDFYLAFLHELKREVGLGIDAKNRFLIAYQSRVIQAADSKMSIEGRHGKLRMAFAYYVETGRIMEEMMTEEENMSYVCPTCNLSTSTAMNLAKHMIGVADMEHIEWIESQNLSFPELIGARGGELGKGNYEPLAAVLEDLAKK